MNMIVSATAVASAAPVAMAATTARAEVRQAAAPRSALRFPQRVPGGALVTEIHAPTNGGTLWSGVAVTKRLRRYSFIAAPDSCISVLLELPGTECTSSRGIRYGNVWKTVAAPESVRKAVLAAIAEALEANYVQDDALNDPIFAAIKRHEQKLSEFSAVLAVVVPGTLSPDEEKESAASQGEDEARYELVNTVPTTMAGAVALLDYMAASKNGTFWDDDRIMALNTIHAVLARPPQH